MLPVQISFRPKTGVIVSAFDLDALTSSDSHDTTGAHAHGRRPKEIVDLSVAPDPAVKRSRARTGKPSRPSSRKRMRSPTSTSRGFPRISGSRDTKSRRLSPSCTSSSKSSGDGEHRNGSTSGSSSSKSHEDVALVNGSGAGRKKRYRPFEGTSARTGLKRARDDTVKGKAGKRIAFGWKMRYGHPK